MASAHTIEYSKTSRAQCHGNPPCKGSTIAAGSLRYGQTISSHYGDTVQWRHWGCVTPTILVQLAAFGLNRINGYSSLKREDQDKIRRAVASRRVDPSDVPETARPPNISDVSGSYQNQKKRKATSDGVASSSTSSTPGVQSYEGEADDANCPEADPIDELYCTLATQIVGVQYYTGLVGSGEEVNLVRDPRNRYDRNAIQVQNIGRSQVGHIPRDIAARLAPLMDRNLVTVEGVMRQGNLTGAHYSLSLEVKIYGPQDKRATLEPMLTWVTPARGKSSQRGGVRASTTSAPSLAAGPNYAAGPSYVAVVGPAAMHMTAAQMEATRKQQLALQNAAELRQMLNNLEKVDDEGRRASLLDTLCPTEDMLNLPLHPNPPGVKNGDLMVDLLRHQSQALQWCIEREYPVLPKDESDKPVQFWQFKKNGAKSYYYNLATKTPQETAPTLGRGALCADSMGLGKTLTMLALILATKSDVPPGYCKGTLIVVPLSVLSNWEKQIAEHCRRDSLTYCVYYAATRSMQSKDLEKYDVVITTYQTVAGQHIDVGSSSEGISKKKKKIESSLFGVQWKRIILDECHTIRNPKTKMAKAACALSAQRRWGLSGTPIINSPRDLGSLLTFLRICQPLDNEDFFKRLILRPLKDGIPSGSELLRALMNSICIRRTKEMKDSNGNPLVPLPPVEMIVVPVKLTDEARALYDVVEQHSKKMFQSYMTGGYGNQFLQANVLSMLTRMRQLALHPGLIPSTYIEQLQASDGTEPGSHMATSVQISAQDKSRLQDLLAQLIEDSEECPICFSILTDPRITTCAHAFCLACVLEVIARDPKCPMDRRPISAADLVEPRPPTELTQAPVRREEDNLSRACAGNSAKIDQLVRLLKLTQTTEKSLIFSQFTSFLDKISEALQEEGIPHVRLDGQMSARRRQEAIERFSIPLEDDGPGEIQEECPIPTRTSRSKTRKTRVEASEPQMDGENDSNDEFVDDAADDDDDDDDDDDVTSSTRRKKGKASCYSKSLKSQFGGENPKVMLLSLKCGSLGLNLTVANNVYLMDPWWQEGIESQAIDRCNRIGQKKPVHVYQLIAENTVEAKVMEIQDKKKLLVQQAFSGIKDGVTQRQKKEARLQDLVQLFGVRQQDVPET